MAEQKPSIGRVVHFVAHGRRHLPFFIIGVKDDGSTCDLVTFGFSPECPAMVESGVRNGNADQEQEAAPGTWHWPERN